MLKTCDMCAEDFLTEADPHVIRPTPAGYKIYCSCMIVGHNQRSGIEKLKLENAKLKEALVYIAKVYDRPTDMKIKARHVLKEIKENDK